MLRRKRRRAPDAGEEAEETMNRFNGVVRNDINTTEPISTESNEDLQQQEEIEEAARLAVRICLALESNRQIIKREHIYKNVLEGKTKLFDRVMSRANAILEETFGMQLVAIPEEMHVASRLKIGAAPGGRMAPARQNGDSHFTRSSQETTQRQTLWLVGNILPESTSWVSPDSPDSRYMGLVYILVAIISLCEGQITKSALKNHLISLGFEAVRTEDPNTGHLIDGLGFSRFLTQITRQGFLYEHKRGTDDQHVYTLGPRAQLQFKREGISSFIKQIYQLSPDPPVNLDNLVERTMEDAI